jgi:carbon-monoxide dehydrogenase large subunit
MAEAVRPMPSLADRCACLRITSSSPGKGRYVDDTKLSGTLYLAILRSPRAHARITGIDLSAARRPRR